MVVAYEDSLLYCEVVIPLLLVLLGSFGQFWAVFGQYLDKKITD